MSSRYVAKREQAINTRAGKGGIHPPPDKRWKKGQSGNPKGRPPGLSITALLRARLEDEAPNTEGKTFKDVLVDVMIREALKGKDQHIREVLDRTEGKAKQGTELSGDVTVRFEYAAEPPKKK